MRKLIVFALAGIIVIAGCKKKSNDGEQNHDFDQSAMLTNMADNLIVPAYQNFSSQCDNFVTTITAFSDNPSSSNLTAVQNQFKTTYKAYLHVEPYDFGPANGTVMLINAVNYWPTKPNLIKTELAASTPVSNDYVNGLGAEKKGFPALGYLLFDITNGNDAVIDSFTTSATAARRKQYVVALAQNIANNAKTIVQEWQNSYAASFKKNTGTELNTSLSLLLNSFVVNFETSKNKRLGIPIGRKDNFTEGPVDPAALELPYTDFAKDILAESVAALSDIYQGKSASGDGLGFDDYAKSLNDDGVALNDSIKTEFSNFKNDIAAIQSPMQTSITTDAGKALVYTSWVESKKMLVLLKVDLAAQLGILITFSDNDGD